MDGNVEGIPSNSGFAAAGVVEGGGVGCQGRWGGASGRRRASVFESVFGTFSAGTCGPAREQVGFDARAGLLQGRAMQGPAGVSLQLQQGFSMGVIAAVGQWLLTPWG